MKTVTTERLVIEMLAADLRDWMAKGPGDSAVQELYARARVTACERHLGEFLSIMGLVAGDLDYLGFRDTMKKGGALTDEQINHARSRIATFI